MFIFCILEVIIIQRPGSALWLFEGQVRLDPKHWVQFAINLRVDAKKGAIVMWDYTGIVRGLENLLYIPSCNQG